MLLVEKLLGSSSEGAYIEDVFSGYLYTGTGALQTITNGINLETVTNEAVYTTPGTYSWTAPEGVTSVCVVAIGGGGGDSYFVNTSTVRGGAPSGSTGGTYTGDGGGNGGNAGTAAENSPTYWAGGGGGGAGGYAGNGGAGGNGVSGTGTTHRRGGGGGGTSLFGQGTAGTGGTLSGATGSGGGAGGGGGANGVTSAGNPGQGGSSGQAGVTSEGGLYGGGGAGLTTSKGGAGLGWKNNIAVTPGQNYTVVVGNSAQGTNEGVSQSGAVRIIWGAGRSFPSTNTSSVVTSGGGLVWLKSRNASSTDHALFDTARGTGLSLGTNLATGQATASTGLWDFLPDGFTLGSLSTVNSLSNKYVSWTFRKQPKFFDIVTYTGNGANRTIAHSLDAIPGCIMIKRTDTTGDWQVYHRGIANTEYMVLNSDAGKATGTDRWNSTTPTSKVFSLGTNAAVNANNGKYVAYLFAHNAGGFGSAGDENVITCGTYTGTGNATQVIDIGYEPQWVMVKNASTTSGWVIADNLRGSAVGGDYERLYANANSAETDINWLGINSKGFEVGTQNNAETNNLGSTFVYIAIRRGPMRKPTSGTSVYTPITYTGGTANVTVSCGYPPDTFITFERGAATALNGYAWPIFDRLLGNNGAFYTTRNAAWSSASWGDSYILFDNNNGTQLVNGAFFLNATSATYGSWSFRKAPGFYDVVNYTGTGTSAAIPHNLDATPELIIVKALTTATDWAVYCDEIGSNQYVVLNSNAAKVSSNSYWNNIAPITTVFTVGSASPVNATGMTYAARLFSTLPNVSKVGSYTGTAALQAVNCGFSSAARFVLIKRTDSTGDWYAWDSARGIVAGNDPYKLINTSATEVTNTDFVDTTTTGFEITAAASATVNINAASYIYLAIS